MVTTYHTLCYTSHWNDPMETYPQMAEMYRRAYSTRTNSLLIIYIVQGQYFLTSSLKWLGLLITYIVKGQYFLTLSLKWLGQTLIEIQRWSNPMHSLIHGHYSHSCQLLLKVFKWWRLEMVKVSQSLSVCLHDRDGWIWTTLTLTPNTMKYWLMFNEEIYRQRHTRLGGQNSNKRITTTRIYNYPFPLLFSK